MDKMKLGLKCLELKHDVRVDIVKGLCILLVVYGHLQRIGALENTLTSIAAGIYTFHMPVFILISGFLFGARTGSVADFRRVIERVLKPYFVVGALLVTTYMSLSLMGITSFSNNESSSWVSLLQGHPGGAVWFLYSLAMVQLIALLWFACAKRISSSVAYDVGYTLLLVLTVHGLRFVKCGVTLPLWFALYFAIGMFIRRWIGTLPGFWQGGVLAVMMLLFFCVDRECVGNYPFVLSLVSFMLWAASLISMNKVGRIIAYVGRHSIALLLFHPFFLGAAKPIYKPMLSVDPTGISGMICVCLLAIIGCLLIDYVIRITFLRKLVY